MAGCEQYDMQDYTGYSKEELSQMTHKDVTYPDDVNIDRGLIDQMLDKDIYTYTIEKRYLSKDGKMLHHGLLTVSLVWNSDNTPKFFITQVVDITKKKELENQIKKKNQELEGARVKLENKLKQLEELNHIIANNLKGPVDKIRTLSEVLVAKSAGPNAANKLSGALSEHEALKVIADSSKSLVNTLDTLIEESDYNG